MKGDCPICFEDLHGSRDPAVPGANCGHFLHAACRQKYFESGKIGCPLCAKPLVNVTLRDAASGLAAAAWGRAWEGLANWQMFSLVVVAQLAALAVLAALVHFGVYGVLEPWLLVIGERCRGITAGSEDGAEGGGKGGGVRAAPAAAAAACAGLGPWMQRGGEAIGSLRNFATTEAAFTPIYWGALISSLLSERSKIYAPIWIFLLYRRYAA